MLKMTPSDGLMTIRASIDADRAELARRARAALDDGRNVVVIATKPGAEGLAFSVRRIGRDFVVSTVLGTMRAGTAAAAVAQGVDKGRGAWDQLN